MSAWFEAIEFIRHVIRARGSHGVHSPYVFKLITQVLPNEKAKRALAPVELLRQKLLKDQTGLSVIDLGAGSRVDKSSIRTISRIAQVASSPSSQLRALFNLVEDAKPTCILELGTNLGLGTCSLALAAPKAQVITVEGDPELSAKARTHFQQMGLDRISSHTGSFAECLRILWEEDLKPDFVLIDGDHRYESTIEYFMTLVEHMNPSGIIVLDDIHWSQSMRKAWDELKSHPKVTLTMDFFHFGILCFSPRLEKEHFVLRLP